MSTLTISGKAIGTKRPLFADWSIPFPPEWGGEGGLTLRDLISRVVRAEVQAFRQPQEERRTFRALTARQLEQGVEKGKIEMGGSELPLQAVDEDEAVAVACQALCIVPVHTQHRGRLFLPFADDDPRTAEVVSKVLLLARDHEIQDPTILEQIRR